MTILKHGTYQNTEDKIPMRPRLPKKLYVERWPEESDRDDMVHYEQTGYGIDQNGRTSTITVYVRETKSKPKRSRRKARR